MDNNFFIKYITDTKSLKQAQLELNNLDKVHQQISQNIPKALKVINTQGQQFIGNNKGVTQKFITDWQAADGSFRRTVSSFNNQGKLLNGSVVDMSSKMNTLGDNFAHIASRALLTIPVWFALRTAFMGLTSTISEGAKYFLDSNQAMVKATNFLSTNLELRKKQEEELAKTSEELSARTGISVKELRNSFSEFATTGLTFEDSITGMKAAAAGSTTMFADLNGLSKSLANTMLLLGDSFTEGLSSEEKYMALMAQIWTLDKTNAVTLQEFADSMLRFAGSAKAMNMNIGETVSLLSALNTAGLKAGKAGTLLRSASLQLFQNYKDISSALGLGVVEGERFAETFERIIVKLNEMNKTGREIEATQVMSKLFGGTRGTTVAQFLQSTLELWKQNNTVTLANADTQRTYIEGFKNRMEEVLSSTYKQVEVTQNMQKVIVAAFFDGINTASNFNTQLLNVNKTLGDIVDNSRNFGKITANALQAPLVNMKILQIVAGTLFGNRDEQKKKAKQLEDSIREIEDNIYNNPVKVTVKVDDKSIQEAESQVRKKLTVDTERKLELLKQELKYVQMEAAGYSEIEVSYQKLIDYSDNLVKQYNELSWASDTQKKNLTTQEFVSLALAGNYEEIKNIFGENLNIEKEILKVAELINEVEKKKIESAKKYGEELKKAISGSLSTLIQGEATLDQFMNDIGTKMRKAWADRFSENLTNVLFKTTGLGDTWGQMLGGMDTMSNSISNSSQMGSNLYYNAILTASQQGAAMYAQTQVGIIGGGNTPTASPLTSMGLPLAGAGIAGLMVKSGNYPGGYAPKGYSDPTGSYSYSGKSSRGLGGSAFLGGFGGKARSPFMGGLMGGISGAMMNYGRGGASMAMSGIGGVLMSIPTPVTMALGALLTIGSMFVGKKPKSVKEESSWNPEAVKDMFPNVGYNVAPLPKLYALPKSSYFGRNSQIKIEINVDKIEGTDKNIVQDIADKISVNMGKALSIDYQRNMMRGDMPNKMIF